MIPSFWELPETAATNTLHGQSLFLGMGESRVSAVTGAERGGCFFTHNTTTDDLIEPMRTRWARIAFAVVAFLALAVQGDVSKLLAEFESGQAEATVKHMIVPLHIYGLANRLRSLASYMQLSKRLNRRLHVSWKITPECGCEWNDIFESPDLQIY